MIRNKLTILLTIPSLLIGLISGTSNAASIDLKTGSPAPAFKLKDQYKNIHELNQYRGEWLVLYFYPKDDTPGCTKEACNFSDNIVKLKNMNTKVLGVSLDDQKSHEKFSKKFNLQFPILSDIDGSTSKAYGSLFSVLGFRFSKRHSFIITPDGAIARIYRDVNAETHSQEIINDLTQLIKNKSID